MDHVLVTGAGGFIGGHLVRRLREDGVGRIRAVDCKPKDEWYQVFDDVENVHADLQLLDACRAATEGVDTVFNLAADMGGMGFIENNKALCMLSVLVSTHVLVAAREAGVERLFYCVVGLRVRRREAGVARGRAAAEADAYPAMPEDGYGWEKLFSERMARHFLEDFGIETRVARYHNVYGPEGTWDGGREKAPAAICRKVATAALTGDHTIEIWGDGEQTRSFTYIDDCLEGTLRLTASDVSEPLNIGSDQLVTINQLVDIVEGIAGVTLERRYKLDAPQGVRGRNSDNTLIRERLGWAPSITPRGWPRGHLRLGARPGGGEARAKLRRVTAGVNRRRALVMADQGVSSLSNVVVSIIAARFALGRRVRRVRGGDGRLPGHGGLRASARRRDVPVDLFGRRPRRPPGAGPRHDRRQRRGVPRGCGGRGGGRDDRRRRRAGRRSWRWRSCCRCSSSRTPGGTRSSSTARSVPWRSTWCGWWLSARCFPSHPPTPAPTGSSSRGASPAASARSRASSYRTGAGGAAPAAVAVEPPADGLTVHRRARDRAGGQPARPRRGRGDRRPQRPRRRARRPGVLRAVEHRAPGHLPRTRARGRPRRAATPTPHADGARHRRPRGGGGGVDGDRAGRTRRVGSGRVPRHVGRGQRADAPGRPGDDRGERGDGSLRRCPVARRRGGEPPRPPADRAPAAPPATRRRGDGLGGRVRPRPRPRQPHGRGDLVGGVRAGARHPACRAVRGAARARPAPGGRHLAGRRRGARRRE